MRLAIAGGGPGGLFLAALVRQADPSIEVTVFERNRADDTFGFGVVFSDRTRRHPRHRPGAARGARPRTVGTGTPSRCGSRASASAAAATPMAAIARRTLLGLPQARAAEVGAALRFGTAVSLADLGRYDLVVAAEGTGSAVRERLEPAFGSTVDQATAKFVWFGPDVPARARPRTGCSRCTATRSAPRPRRSSWRPTRRRGGRRDSTGSTCRSRRGRATWSPRPTSRSCPPSRSAARRCWSTTRGGATSGPGAPLVGRRWIPGPVALLGDAAHFSVGSGTKMAMEDAVAGALTDHPGDLPAALAAYEKAARPSVEAIQGSARPSLSIPLHDRRPGAEPSGADRVRHQAGDHGGLPAGRRPPSGIEPGPGPWGAWVAAPGDETGLPAARTLAADLVTAGAVLVAVHAGTPSTRLLLTEDVRLNHGVPSLLVDPHPNPARALTAVLSGRTDLTTTAP